MHAQQCMLAMHAGAPVQPQCMLALCMRGGDVCCMHDGCGVCVPCTASRVGCIAGVLAMHAASCVCWHARCGGGG
jgi:hypothetical protein